jgi:predicted RNA-binding Zn ribbon-like protein
LQHIPTKLDHGFEYIGGDLSTDFINTKSGRISGNVHEHVETYADVVEFVRQAGFLKPAEARRLIAAAEERPEKATQVHRRALALRESTFRAYERLIQEKDPAPDDLAVMGAEASKALSHACFVKSPDGFSWEWSDTDDLERPLWPIARAVADVLIHEENRSLLRECSDDTCAWLFIDRSKNHTRRWCDMETCGNRAKQRRFEERQKRVAARAR